VLKYFDELEKKDHFANALYVLHNAELGCTSCSSGQNLALKIFAGMLITSVHKVMLLKFGYHMKCEAFTKQYFKTVISEYHGRVISEYQIPDIS